ncbi:MAG: HipA N-terminal domain-containing protein [Candidatus Omnitrophica bacterium]|nr:HipA N-terminal domain-containing protein [Candidatus Omnitrophota bacterium]
MSGKIFRKAQVNYNNQLAGYLWEIENGFRFVYDEDYLRAGQPVSVSLPLRQEPYEAKELFSFFQGLLPEGWYLDIVSATAKIDTNDSFGLLLATTGDTIGAVTVHKVKTQNHGS